MNQILVAALCPHRGLGEENTLRGIRAAIDTKPFMVEFDVQNRDGDLFLGHPPHARGHERLEQALNLFVGTVVIAKIDLKCGSDWQEDIDKLLWLLEKFKLNTIINLSGDALDSSSFMAAETYLMQRTGSTVLLNIDIARYGEKDRKAVKKHVSSLARKPFCASPMLEGDYDREIAVALECGIQNIHFWSNSTQDYSEEQLLALIDKYAGNGVKVHFDINPALITV